MNRGETMMPEAKITVVEYANTYAKSISEHLFKGVAEGMIIKQRQELLEPGHNEVFSVCALHDNEVVGVCTGVRMRWYGSRHRIEMVQVVVRDGFRGRGIAREMMRKIAKHFGSRGIEIVQISVEAKNTVARNAYEKIGFKKFGVLKNGINHGGNYSDEVMLAMPLSELVDVKS
jgi:RimJ/RimL family protein N-acetyltransferase